MSHLKLKRLLRNTALITVLTLPVFTLSSSVQASWYNPFSWFNSPPYASSLTDEEIKGKAIEFAIKAKNDRRIRVGDARSSTYAVLHDNNTNNYMYTVSGWNSQEFSNVSNHLTLLPQLDPRTTNQWAKNLGYINPVSKEQGFAGNQALDMNKPWYVWGSKYIGTHNASHSEIQMLYNFHNDFVSGKKYAIGFAQKSRSKQTMCGSCQPFLKFYTRKFQLRVAVASSRKMYFFDKGATIITNMN